MTIETNPFSSNSRLFAYFKCLLALGFIYSVSWCIVRSLFWSVFVFVFVLFWFVLFCFALCFVSRSFIVAFYFATIFLLPTAASGPRRLRRPLPFVCLLCPRDTTRQFHSFVFRLHAWTLPPPSRESSSSPLSRPRFGWTTQRPPARLWSSVLRRPSFRSRRRAVRSNLPVFPHFCCFHSRLIMSPLSFSVSFTLIFFFFF